jgi:tRNA A22 N-methylase
VAVNVPEMKLQLQELEQTIFLSKKKIVNLKQQLSERESELIEATLVKEKLFEELQKYHDVVFYAANTDKKDEVEDFRRKFPELCAMAKERDEVK